MGLSEEFIPAGNKDVESVERLIAFLYQEHRRLPETSDLRRLHLSQALSLKMLLLREGCGG